MRYLRVPRRHEQMMAIQRDAQYASVEADDNAGDSVSMS